MPQCFWVTTATDFKWLVTRLASERRFGVILWWKKKPLKFSSTCKQWVFLINYHRSNGTPNLYLLHGSNHLNKNCLTLLSIGNNHHQYLIKVSRYINQCTNLKILLTIGSILNHHNSQYLNLTNLSRKKRNLGMLLLCFHQTCKCLYKDKNHLITWTAAIKIWVITKLSLDSNPVIRHLKKF